MQDLWSKLSYSSDHVRVAAMFLDQPTSGSAVVDKLFVNKIGDKTAILRKCDMSTKILFCRHNNIQFWKRKDTFQKQNIDKISLQKGMTVSKSALSSECSSMLDPQPVTVYPASPRDPSRKFGFWSEHQVLHLFPDHCFVDICRHRDEIWPDMSTKKSVLDRH